MPKIEYEEGTVRNISQGYRGICTTSEEEAEHSRTLDPGETVTVFLSEQEKRDLIATGDFEEVQDAPAARASAALAAKPAQQGKADNAPSDEEIRAAILMLDPDDDTHWTKEGLPAMEAVERMLGRDTTRVAINAAAPDAKRPGPV